jgi:hypothetical protein
VTDSHEQDLESIKSKSKAVAAEKPKVNVIDKKFDNEEQDGEEEDGEDKGTEPSFEFRIEPPKATTFVLPSQDEPFCTPMMSLASQSMSLSLPSTAPINVTPSIPPEPIKSVSIPDTVVPTLPTPLSVQVCDHPF